MWSDEHPSSDWEAAWWMRKLGPRTSIGAEKKLSGNISTFNLWGTWQFFPRLFFFVFRPELVDTCGGSQISLAQCPVPTSVRWCIWSSKAHPLWCLAGFLFALGEWNTARNLHFSDPHNLHVHIAQMHNSRPGKPQQDMLIIFHQKSKFSDTQLDPVIYSYLHICLW